jgi:type II secretory pathway component GspD/PulD (secretin)
MNREEATFRLGERYPVMMGAYSVLGGVAESSAQTTPQVQYVDLGLTLKVKPFVEDYGNVLLHVDLDLDSLAGSSLNGIPVLSNRRYSGVVSVHGGNSALLVSVMSKQDSQELTGVPGLSNIPGSGGATNRQDMTDTAELVVLITPHIVRTARRESAGEAVSTGRSE